MTGILARYLARAILATSALVLFVLLVLAAIFGFVGELDDVGEGSYGVLDAATYVALTLPGMAYELFAPAVLLGSLLGLGGLAANSELAVMRAAGMSNARIVGAVLLAGLVPALGVVLVGETLMPSAARAAEELRLSALEERASGGAGDGLWVRSGPRYVSIGTVLADRTLLDVTVHEFDGTRLVRATRAARASLEDGAWWLDGASVTDLDREAATVVRTERLAWESLAPDAPELVDPSVLSSLSTEPEALSMRQLADQAGYLRANSLESREVELALWTKLAAPLSTLVMLMLSLPFAFGARRGGGAGQKIFLGIMLGIGYVLVSRLLVQLALNGGFGPAASAFLPVVLFALVAAAGVRRIG